MRALCINIEATFTLPIASADGAKSDYTAETLQNPCSFHAFVQVLIAIIAWICVYYVGHASEHTQRH